MLKFNQWNNLLINFYDIIIISKSCVVGIFLDNALNKVFGIIAYFKVKLGKLMKSIVCVDIYFIKTIYI